ncbi:MAG: hypothetical protein IKT77_08395 [Paludibacteraceae bacterium]|nr:hypothetical protein [Paludibacteraceae bacterium]MBR6520984.1 hypothetical protein [Paludibacteraceae bacterium]
MGATIFKRMPYPHRRIKKHHCGENVFHIMPFYLFISSVYGYVKYQRSEIHI